MGVVLRSPNATIRRGIMRVAITRCAGGAGGWRGPWLQGTKNVLRVVAVKPDVDITRVATVPD